MRPVVSKTLILCIEKLLLMTTKDVIMAFEDWQGCEKCMLNRAIDNHRIKDNKRILKTFRQKS